MKLKVIIRFLLTVAVLYAIWLLLSGKFDLLHGGLGLVGSIVIGWLFFRWEDHYFFPVGKFLWFVPWLLWQIFWSNLHVARLVLSREMRIQPEFIRIKPKVVSDHAMTLLGCGITLTPGTVTVDIHREEMIVHALDGTSAGGVKDREIESRVQVVFGEEGEQ